MNKPRSHASLEQVSQVQQRCLLPAGAQYVRLLLVADTIEKRASAVQAVRHPEKITYNVQEGGTVGHRECRGRSHDMCAQKVETKPGEQGETRSGTTTNGTGW